jgi:hypothetical protein
MCRNLKGVKGREDKIMRRIKREYERKRNRELEMKGR